MNTVMFLMVGGAATVSLVVGCWAIRGINLEALQRSEDAANDLI